MKNTIIAMQLFLFMLLGTIGIFAFGLVMVDSCKDGKINREVQLARQYESGNVAEIILEMLRQEKLSEVVSFCENNDMKIAIYRGDYRPIYNNMILNNMSLEEQRKNSVEYHSNYEDESAMKYTLYLYRNGDMTDYKTNHLLLMMVASFWDFFYGNFNVIGIGFAVSVFLLAFAFILILRWEPLTQKIWVFLLYSSIVMGGLIVIFCGEYKWVFLAGLLLEKILIGSIAYRYLFFMSKAYARMQRVSILGDENEKHKKALFTMQSFTEELDAMSERLSEAVNEKMKSERLKTELITNVSHDLKTPLTSIINFSDLISKEAPKEGIVAEYATHLHKQSVKLKNLLEALLEASKAATGALDVNLESCNVHIMLEQCVVEYEQKLSDMGIRLVENYPDDEMLVMADVQFLRRIFDNLLQNICKYAMQDTRVYLDAKSVDEKVIISFKNISKEPLNISADELTERFVRADSSRHSEGNGLGLSIVKSLMDLQNADMRLSVNADLFMVELVFDDVSAATQSVPFV